VDEQRWLTYQDLHGPQTVRLSVGEWVIGRGEDCEIVVKDYGCSRRHAKIVVAPDGVRIADLKSKSGTHVRGRPVTEARLEDGDEVRLGMVVFRYSEGLPPEPPAFEGGSVYGEPSPGLARLTAALQRPAGSINGDTRIGELGDSLPTLMYAMHEIGKAFGVDLPFQSVRDLKTVGELLDVIERRQS